MEQGMARNAGAGTSLPRTFWAVPCPGSEAMAELQVWHSSTGVQRGLAGGTRTDNLDVLWMCYRMLQPCSGVSRDTEMWCEV